MAKSKIQTGLRIEENTYCKLKTLSEKENRSLNNLIEYIIQRHIEDYEANNGTIPLADPPSD